MSGTAGPMNVRTSSGSASTAVDSPSPQSAMAASTDAYVERRIARDEHEVAPSPALDRPLAGDDGDLREPRRRRRDLGTDEAERRVVDEVRDVRAARAEHPRHLVEELGRREVPRDGEAAEGVADHEVERVRRERANRLPRVSEAHVDAIAGHVPELRSRDVVDLGIELQHGLSRFGMHGLDVAREREPAAADVQDIG